jgi:tetratricopeptide (TPR) repeat protein
MKNIKNSFIHLLTTVLFFIILTSCKKDWLDAKPQKSLVIPNKIEDFQALLDNTSTVFNLTQGSGLGEISAGDFYVQYSTWQALSSSQEKSSYIWEKTENFYNGEASADWTNSYKRILYSNVIIEGINKINPHSTELAAWNNVMGSALFFRAFDLYNLSQQFCSPYLPSTALTELGLPLRLKYDVNLPVERSNLQQTYERIIGDLKVSIPILSTTPLYKTRPSKQAAYALLARIYLSMETYDQAILYADSALQIQNTLIDYSKLSASNSFPIDRFNPEVIFHSSFTFGIFRNTRLIVDPILLASYNTNDFRKKVFFTPVADGETYKGSYTGSSLLFGGLAVDEMLLIRAECNARKGNISIALNDLNKLLKNRWNENYQDISITDPTSALTYILAERRKELIYRGIRWSDLRRLNRDSRFGIILTKTLNGVTYSLLPNDKRYVLPIDEIEIRLSGIQQNNR